MAAVFFKNADFFESAENGIIKEFESSHDDTCIKVGFYNEGRIGPILLPGRIRLQSNRLVNNKSLSAQVYQYISSYKEIDTVEVNTVTGSVLLMYKPQILRSNRELAEIEHYIMTHVERRP